MSIKTPKRKKKEWGKENFELRYIVVKTKKRKEKSVHWVRDENGCIFGI